MCATQYATDTAELYCYGEIGVDVESVDFVRDLKSLEGDERVIVRINSGGGNLTEGLTIAAAIKRARSRGQIVQTVNDGFALSAASLVFCAGNPAVMSRGSLLMIHAPYSPSGGGSEELRRKADLIDEFTDQLIDVYHARSGQPKATIRTWLTNEKWFDGKEAVAAKLADTIEDGLANSAALMRSREIMAHKIIPQEYLNRLRAPIDTALSDFSSYVRWACDSRRYEAFRSFRESATRIAGNIAKMQNTESADLELVCAGLDKLKQSEDWPRDFY